MKPSVEDEVSKIELDYNEEMEKSEESVAEWTEDSTEVGATASYKVITICDSVHSDVEPEVHEIYVDKKFKSEKDFLESEVIVRVHQVFDGVELVVTDSEEVSATQFVAPLVPSLGRTAKGVFRILESVDNNWIDFRRILRSVPSGEAPRFVARSPVLMNRSSKLAQRN